jgi:hypothetical protein
MNFITEHIGVESVRLTDRDLDEIEMLISRRVPKPSVMRQTAE